MGGKTVIPGFIDPHSHFMMTAQNFTNADLTGAASIAEVQQRLRDFIEKRGVTAEGVVQATATITTPLRRDVIRPARSWTRCRARSRSS